jgi:ATP-binding cassette subfamily B protein
MSDLSISVNLPEPEPVGRVDVAALLWPASRVGEALDELARRSGLNAASDAVTSPAAVARHDDEDLARWLAWAAERLGLEAEPVETPASELDELVTRAAPALFQVTLRETSGFMVLLRAKRGTVYLIRPDLKVERCAARDLRDALCTPYEGPFRVEIEKLLATAEVPPSRRGAVRSAMMRDRLGKRQIGRCWLLRVAPSAPFRRQLAHARLPRRAAIMLSVFAFVYALETVGWALIGQTTLNGRLDLGWLAAWGLMVLSLVPLRLLGSWLDGTIALEVGRLLKARLLTGALQSDLESVKHQGAGQLLSRVMDSQALESLALNGGFGVLVAVLELLFAATILAAGAGGRIHVLLLGGWLALTLALSWRYFRRLRLWTFKRLDMTHDLVERMVGHRTRLAQEHPARRVDRDDQTIKDYVNVSRDLDHAISPIVGALPRGWIMLALVGLAPAFVSGSASAADLAIALGGMLLANRALLGIAGGLGAISRAGIAWTQVSSLFRSADKKASAAAFLTGAQIAPAATSGGGALIEASKLVFRYREKGDAVLQGVDLSVKRGERILVEGSSGGGKSTLAGLLVGLRSPESGLLLLNGLDRHTLGESWHRLATEAPQFHENHILSGTLAFNLLMGRNWPPTEAELDEAKALCVELGLGDLIDRMPSGMMQMVGETGWQLSHGEKSRIFLARALLQKAQLTILDESFAALDPETLEKCLNCAFERAATLMVIAHP